MNKGIVMEMTEKSIVVMRHDGHFEKISRKNRTCEVGEEIVYADQSPKWASPPIALRSAIAAAVVFCIVLAVSFSGKLGTSQVVAYVSMDINPSVEMGIDANEQVLELRGLNPDGTALVQAVDYEGKTLEEVTAALLDKAEQNALAAGSADIVIASTVIQETSAVNDAQIADKLRQQVTNHLKKTHPDQADAYHVEAFAAPREIRSEASKSGVSMGKYSVYLYAKKQGIDVTVDELKTESIHQIIEENSHSASAILEPDKLPSKDLIRQLIELERSGELDKRLEEWKREQSIKVTGNRGTASTSDQDAFQQPGGGSSNAGVQQGGDNAERDSRQDNDYIDRRDSREATDEDDDDDGRGRDDRTRRDEDNRNNGNGSGSGRNYWQGGDDYEADHRRSTPIRESTTTPVKQPPITPKPEERKPDATRAMDAERGDDRADASRKYDNSTNAGDEDHGDRDDDKQGERNKQEEQDKDHQDDDDSEHTEREGQQENGSGDLSGSAELNKRLEEEARKRLEEFHKQLQQKKEQESAGKEKEKQEDTDDDRKEGPAQKEDGGRQSDDRAESDSRRPSGGDKNSAGERSEEVQQGSGDERKPDNNRSADNDRNSDSQRNADGRKGDD
ncbi:anti-sigma-I factor RsgI family protein [Paenibacillus xerothermodurans]|uniref:RsgI N-terminal anti-sigma domain-containing protein n=1 Tax=Paenibacillus xerothermodurans TaxID=1977292 RepID=A0A2W1NPC9_PAEXE|nr:anti-sigma factor domain-containing protein [Paenibacillus xerothermodurans]PZE20763.1 hypothetical protein CBW46_011415 [Paenibacillus xerothermodurans]